MLLFNKIFLKRDFMTVIKLKKNSSELERKLFNKIKQLKYEIIIQPAYPRKKK